MSAANYRLVVRDAAVADRPMIVEFNRRLAVETEGKVLDPAVLDRGVARALADPDRLRYWVAEWRTSEEAFVVGQTAITREWSDWRHGWVWWLQSVYVDAGFRGKGIFRALYQHIREAARAEPEVIGIRLYVENSNLRAQKTYEALGMKPGGYSVLEELWLGRSQGE
jgi:ribosomal protein S18 acetylase RimI-like enzyme